MQFVFLEANFVDYFECLSSSDKKKKELSETYSESCQVYTMKLFAKVVNGFHQNIIFTKNSIIDIWQSSRYVFVELSRGHRT